MKKYYVIYDNNEVIASFSNYLDAATYVAGIKDEKELYEICEVIFND